jgi:hypothetical protein
MAKTTRRPIAAPIPIVMAFRRWSAGSPEAASAMTIALSPERGDVDQDDLEEC